MFTSELKPKDIRAQAGNCEQNCTSRPATGGTNEGRLFLALTAAVWGVAH